jgi:hypothetical protein
MIWYIGIAILFIIILFIMYIKLRHRFWAAQPVFHFYDLYYYFFNVGVIRHELPQKNRYTNFKNIEFKTINSSLNNRHRRQFLTLIQNHYLQDQDNHFCPKMQNILPYFMGHGEPSFISLYYESVLLEDTKNHTFIDDKKLIGAMTTRPLKVTMNFEKDKQTETAFNIYYVDYLCVDKAYRKKNIAPQLIQTHEYHQCHKNQNICVSLFKREGELTGIVPLCVYKTYCFSMSLWTTPFPLPPLYSMIEGDTQNIFHVYNFIQEQINNKTNKTKKWEMTILPDISNVIELIKTKNIFVRMNIDNENQEIIGIYFFRKVCTSISKGKNILACFASIQSNKANKSNKGNKSNKKNDELFIHGFKVAVSSIIKKHIDAHFHYLSMENISDNNIIINYLLLKNKPYVVSPTAYFFYNFAYQTFPSNNILIIN